jgi:hypothetical protein
MLKWSFSPPRSTAMDPDLRSFVRQFLGVVAMALVPVVLAAFVSLPLALGHHPGEPRPADAESADRHMT